MIAFKPSDSVRSVEVPSNGFRCCVPAGGDVRCGAELRSAVERKVEWKIVSSWRDTCQCNVIVRSRQVHRLTRRRITEDEKFPFSPSSKSLRSNGPSYKTAPSPTFHLRWNPTFFQRGFPPTHAHSSHQIWRPFKTTVLSLRNFPTNVNRIPSPSKPHSSREPSRVLRKPEISPVHLGHTPAPQRLFRNIPLRAFPSWSALFPNLTHPGDAPRRHPTPLRL